jgi:hypothetical protein
VYSLCCLRRFRVLHLAFATIIVLLYLVSWWKFLISHKLLILLLLRGVKRTFYVNITSVSHSPSIRVKTGRGFSWNTVQVFFSRRCQISSQSIQWQSYDKPTSWRKQTFTRTSHTYGPIGVKLRKDISTSHRPARVRVAKIGALKAVLTSSRN